ncbi:Uncharacterised protein [Klebsiella pneumoniae]|nr:Uncharacterised protein [Klebsiella pneumoniae]
MMLNDSGCGAGALCSQSAPPPLAGAAVEAPPQASAACAALSVAGALSHGLV